MLQCKFKASRALPHYSWAKATQQFLAALRDVAAVIA
jgi:hypothetical protein